MVRALTTAAFFCLLVLPVAVPALDAPPAYTDRIWQMQDGLPEQTVQAFAQTKDRYLWIGTTGGLLRFDGVRLVLFDRENTPAFTENNVFNLMVARDGTLWIATEGGGLIRYKDGAFRSFSARDGLLNDFVRAVYQDSKGMIWIGTDDGLFRLSDERIERVDNRTGVPSIAVHAIQEDSEGRLWVGGSRLLCLNHNTAQEYRLQGEGSAPSKMENVTTRAWNDTAVRNECCSRKIHPVLITW